MTSDPSKTPTEQPLPVNIRVPLNFSDGEPPADEQSPITLTVTLSDVDARRLADTDIFDVRILGDLMLTIHEAVQERLRMEETGGW